MPDVSSPHIRSLEVFDALERLYVNVRPEYPFSVRDKELVEGAVDHLIAEQHRMASSHRQEVERLQEQYEVLELSRNEFRKAWENTQQSHARLEVENRDLKEQLEAANNKLAAMGVLEEWEVVGAPTSEYERLKEHSELHGDTTLNEEQAREYWGAGDDFKIVRDAMSGARVGMPHEAFVALQRIEEQYEDLAVRADERLKMIDEADDRTERMRLKYADLKEQLEALQEKYDDLWQRMDSPFDKEHRLVLFSKREIQDMHHALRMFAKYPGLSDEEKAGYTALADELWNHHAAQVAASYPASEPEAS